MQLAAGDGPVLTGVQMVVWKLLPALAAAAVQVWAGAVALITVVAQVVAVKLLPALAAAAVQLATSVGPVVTV